MKKIILAAVVASAFASPAFAQVAADAPTSVSIPLEGQLAKRCTISAFLNGPFNALNLESTAVQGKESVTGRCNYGGSATVTFSSANAGNLKSGNNLVPYLFHVEGSGSDWSAGKSLSTAQSIDGFPAVANANQTRAMSVSLPAIATVAGTYTDTVTAAITPN